MSKIGDVIVKMLLKSDDYEKGLARSKKSTQSFAQTITKGFTAAIGKVAALVGAIVGIAKALDSISKANQAFGDKWASFTSGLKGAWDEFTRAVASFDFSHLFSRLREASDAARDLYAAMDGMGEIMTSYNIAAAEQAKHLAQLRVEMNNQNLSIDERIEKAQEYLRITKQLESMPLRGLSRVSDATLKKVMTQMGYDFAGKTEEQIKAAKKYYIDFFKWLGTEQGEYWNNQGNEIAGLVMDLGTYKGAQYIKKAKKEGVEGYARLAVAYNKSVSDKDREALEKAIVEYLRADAAFDESTRRVQVLLNSLEYQRNKKEGDVVAKVTNADEEVRKRVADMRANFQPLEKLPEIVGVVSTQMPDIISDEWLRRQQEQMEKAQKFFEEMKEKSAAVAQEFGNAVQNGIVSSIDMLTEAIGSGEDIDGGAVIKALLSPLADACISAGLLIISTGEAVEALRETLLAGLATGGYAAIVAGAALIAVGAAAKIGLAAIGSGQSRGSVASSSAAASASSGSTTQMIKSELTINVRGTIKGSDIVISGQRTVNSWGR